MNAKTVGASIWLLLFGTASVLLIAAFAPRFDAGGQPDGTAPGAPAPAPAAAGADTTRPAAASAVASAGMPMLPLNLSPGLAEIIKLAQAHIGDDTILAYIQNSGQSYNPSADEILYLSDLGVSDKVVAALVNKPDAGKTVPGSGGLRKLRWSAGGHGKRGGIRVIYYRLLPRDAILLLYAYPKSEQDDLTAEQLRQIRKVVEREYL